MEKVIFWFRRDLRLADNAGLYHALRSGKEVIPLFIFDKEILNGLKDRKDARVTFIHDTIRQLKLDLRAIGSDLIVKFGSPLTVWKEVVEEYSITAVFTNRDYEPYAKQRDEKIAEFLSSKNIGLIKHKDHVIFESDEVLKDDGNPYTVFTPYKRKWLTTLAKENTTNSYFLSSYPTSKYHSNFSKFENGPSISLEQMGFERSSISIPPAETTQSIIKNYHDRRNFPALNGTSRLGIHFRFGTISIREKARKAAKLSETYLSELIWRDFYSQILDHFPHIVTQAFRAKYDRIPWRNNKEDFEKWCKGETGYPIVDAGMRELNSTGHMHNRVRMITASFLTKHLLIDWRWGEAYFAEKLLDFDLASNNGGWQWASGSGTDAAPYFRIFNPHTQLDKFDKNREYTKRFVPEIGTDTYPNYIVDHKFARERCLETYKAALNS